MYIYLYIYLKCVVLHIHHFVHTSKPFLCTVLYSALCFQSLAVPALYSRLTKLPLTSVFNIKINVHTCVR